MIKFQMLGIDTTEAKLIYRVGPVVYKILRPVEEFRRHMNWQVRRDVYKQAAVWRRMAEVSVGNPPLNPILYCEHLGVMVSRYIEGRMPTPEELQDTIYQVEALDLGIYDVSRYNVIVSKDGPVVVDWQCVLTSHP